MEPLYWLLIALPAAIVLEVVHADPVWIFLAACVAILPLAGLMGRATENLAATMGPSIGGLLNATFGNAAELIIAFLALWKGETELVKASITGSILGNVLLVLGLAIVLGGLKYRRQTFNRTAAALGATLLGLASIALIIPTVHAELQKREGIGSQPSESSLLLLSDEIAIVLAVVYLLSLVFTLKTHQHLFAGPEAEADAHHEAEWSRRTSLIVLLVATAGVALMAEFLVGSVQHAASALGLNKVFIGVIVVAVIGNAAEHSTAVLVAMKDKMDLAVTIAIGSSLQIALFVAPLLVFGGLLIGVPLDLHFSLLEVVAVVVAIAVVALIAQDGETHWMEGVLLLAVYLILALAFFNYPQKPEPSPEARLEGRMKEEGGERKEGSLGDLRAVAVKNPHPHSEPRLRSFSVRGTMGSMPAARRAATWPRRKRQSSIVSTSYQGDSTAREKPASWSLRAVSSSTSGPLHGMSVKIGGKRRVQPSRQYPPSVAGTTTTSFSFKDSAACSIMASGSVGLSVPTTRTRDSCTRGPRKASSRRPRSPSPWASRV